ncbi:LysR substrate-binding domain-containing protein [Burkholderia ambifaria]|uniref:LysR substrate-binding domain-containing protein n=1 Tax=Burkholderia ambifaria TaxID=152480 RepID=UPI003D15FF9F
MLFHLDDLQGEWPWYAWDHLLWMLGAPGLLPAGALRFSQYDQFVQAVVDGHGIGIRRRPLVNLLLKQGRLVELFLHCAAASGNYVIIRNPDSSNEPDIAILITWLLERPLTTHLNRTPLALAATLRRFTALANDSTATSSCKPSFPLRCIHQLGNSW